MYKHGTYSLYLRVKNKKQLERERERKKNYEAVNHFFSKIPLIISKRRVCNHSHFNNNKFEATLSAPRGGKRDEY